jgi:hypothetical protein
LTCCTSRSGYAGNTPVLLEETIEQLCEAGLVREETLKNNYSTFPGMRLTLPDASKHSIPKDAAPGTFFEIPGLFFELGAGLIWTCGACDVRPLSEYALRLYVALTSEQDLLRYGGVDPAVLSFRGRRLILGGILTDWDPTLIARALSELESRALSIRRPSTISTIDRHVIRRGFHACHLDEQNVQVIAIRTE